MIIAMQTQAQYIPENHHSDPTRHGPSPSFQGAFIKFIASMTCLIGVSLLLAGI
jgi:hypothetical protein